jgi:para-aminobenzoate synthetase component 1
MSFESLNTLGKERKPFLFICDYKAENIKVILQEELKSADIEFSIDADYKTKNHSHTLVSQPISFVQYKQKFDAVIEKIKSGETYILNLTQPTSIQTELSLKEIYALANAHYKLRFKDKFICFSPETFVKIEGDTIHTYPMKGTIDASKESAIETILADTKELAEHIMIVDLLRNDISIVATDVKVEKFRYITEIEAGERKLLQVSSHISGVVGVDWHEKIGDILQALLPAGSITGAPKKSTVEIIEDIEGYNRDYFSGIFGFYDGEKLDSAVMIRFIEKDDEKYIYKSGGGITLDSSVESEYNELQEKIYLP